MLLDDLSGALLALPRMAKRILAVAVDASLGAVTMWLSFSLVFQRWKELDNTLAVMVLLCWALALPLFAKMGLYRAIFRFSGAFALSRVALAVAIYGIAFFACLMALGYATIPVTIGILQPILLLVAVIGVRSIAHFWLGERYLQKLGRADIPRVVIYGAGSAGRQLAAGLGKAAHESRLIAYVDDDKNLVGNSINGCKVYHPKDLKTLVEDKDVTDVLLALPSVERQRRIEILASLRQLPVHVRTLPGLSDLATGRVDLNAVQELDIDDLLGRAAVAPNQELLVRHIAGYRVAVTGAGGSIGSELCRQILRCRPEKLLLIEVSEYALYQIHQDLLTKQRDDPTLAVVEIVPLLASVQDRARISTIMDVWRPQTVYHAAAYKHVPLVEHNPAEGLRNNVWGTWICAEASARSGVSNFVLISTDKAVRPTNIMGASKRLAEMVLQALAQKAASLHAATAPNTCFSMVRFGNVLGSSGSVVPLFREQIKKGGPITLTHLEITRFFMTIPEAAQLVIQAGAMAKGGDVFVLDMGEPVKIVDLAKRMIELSGASVRDDQHPTGDIAIEVTGLRPGEKLYEELLIGNNPQATVHPRIMRAEEDCLAVETLGAALASLEKVMDAGDIHATREWLVRLVSGYQPSGEVVDWVYLESAR